MDRDLLRRVEAHELTVVELRDELRKRNAKVTGNKSTLEARLIELLSGRPATPARPLTLTPQELLQKINAHELTVDQLKEELRARNLQLKGNKAELEARLRAHLTTQIAHPGVSPVVPGQAAKKLKFRVPSGAATVPRRKIAEQEVPTPPEIQRIINLAADLAQGRISLEQQKVAMQALGMSTEGSDEAITDKFQAYLNAFSQLNPSRWPLSVVDTSQREDDQDLGFLFDLYWRATTEQAIQALRPNDWISFYDNDKFNYYTLQVTEVVRGPLGLVHEIKMNVPDYVIIRSKSRWRLSQRTAEGLVSFDGPLAVHLKLV